MAVIGLLAQAPLPAAGDAAELWAGTPFVASHASASWQGSRLLYFGGYQGAPPTQSVDSVGFVNMDTRQSALLPAKLPSPRFGMGTAQVGGDVLLFGGCCTWTGTSGGGLATVLAYDVANGALRTTGASLLPSWGMAAVAANGFVYLFGGAERMEEDRPERLLDTVIRYDPVAETTVTLAAELPGPRVGVAAAKVGDRAVLVGGWGPDACDVLLFDFPSESFVGAPAPTSCRAWPAALYDGSRVVAYGGMQGEWPNLTSTMRADALAIDPGTLATEPMPAALPSPRCCMAAASLGTRGFLLGGRAPTAFLADLLRVDTATAGPPVGVAAATGAGRGELVVAWDPPPHHPEVSGYLVYRGLGPSFRLMQAVAQTTATSFVDTGLPDGATRFYRVTALSAAGEGFESSAVSARTAVLPGAPRGVGAAPGGGLGEVTLSWSPPADTGGQALTAYRVFRGGATGERTFLAEVSGTTTTFVDAARSVGTVWSYDVGAVNSVGMGPRSDRVLAPGTGVPG